MSETTMDSELDLTERKPSKWELEDLWPEVPRDAEDKPRTAEDKRRTLPPPIPAAAMARGTIPPPVPTTRPDEVATTSPIGRESASKVTTPIKRQPTSKLTIPPPIPVAARATGSHPIPPPIPVAARATGSHPIPPPIPVAARATGSHSIPPPIPVAARTRQPSLPPPIPARARTNTSSVPTSPPLVAERARQSSSDDVSVEVDMTSFWERGAAPAKLPVATPAVATPALPEPTLPQPAPAILAPTTPPLVVAPASLPVVVAPTTRSEYDDPTPLPRPVVEDSWFDASRLAAPEDDGDVRWHSTSVVTRAPVPIVKLALAAMIVSGLSAAIVVSLRGNGNARRSSAALHAAPSAEAPVTTETTTPTAPAEQANAATTTPAAPAEQPLVEPTQAPNTTTVEPPQAPSVAAAEQATTTAAAVATTTGAQRVAVISQPAGATITLVEDGVNSVVGQTPLVVNVDRARRYEVVVALAGYRTKVAHLDPKVDELRVGLVSDDSSAASPSAEPVKAPKAEEAPKAEARSQSKRPAKRPRMPDEKRAPKNERVAVAAPPSGTGILMVSSKPPCEIAIDGVATVLTTPQRSIKLKAGKHKVTLFNVSRKIDATFEVVIEADKPTKLIKDFMR